MNKTLYDKLNYFRKLLLNYISFEMYIFSVINIFGRKFPARVSAAGRFNFASNQITFAVIPLLEFVFIKCKDAN